MTSRADAHVHIPVFLILEKKMGGLLVRYSSLDKYAVLKELDRLHQVVSKGKERFFFAEGWRREHWIVTVNPGDIARAEGYYGHRRGREGGQEAPKEPEAMGERRTQGGSLEYSRSSTGMSFPNRPLAGLGEGASETSNGRYRHVRFVLGRLLRLWSRLLSHGQPGDRSTQSRGLG